MPNRRDLPGAVAVLGATGPAGPRDCRLRQCCGSGRSKRPQGPAGKSGVLSNLNSDTKGGTRALVANTTGSYSSP